MSKLKAEDNLKHVSCRKVALADTDTDPENMKTSGFPRQWSTVYLYLHLVYIYTHISIYISMYL